MSRKDAALYIFSFPTPKPDAWTEHTDKWTSYRVRESPGTPHEFFSLGYSRILLFSFTFLLTEGTLPISWCPEIPFYVARHFVLFFLTNSAQRPHIPLTIDLYAQEKTERCWCFWLVFMPSVPPLFFFLYEYTCFLGCLHWNPSVRMAQFLLASGIRPLLEGVGFRQWWVFKRSSRSPAGRHSPVSVWAPPASFHINTPVETSALKAGKVSRWGGGSHRA